MPPCTMCTLAEQAWSHAVMNMDPEVAEIHTNHVSGYGDSIYPESHVRGDEQI